MYKQEGVFKSTPSFFKYFPRGYLLRPLLDILKPNLQINLNVPRAVLRS